MMMLASGASWQYQPHDYQRLTNQASGLTPNVLNSDRSKERTTLGPWLKFDRKTETFKGKHADADNALVKENYRKAFSIPEKV